MPIKEYTIKLTIFYAIGIIIVFLIIFLVIRSIWKAIKKFSFELNEHTNGTAPRPNGGQPNYTYTYNTKKPKYTYTAEARRACEKVTPKRNQDEKPPWEE